MEQILPSAKVNLDFLKQPLISFKLFCLTWRLSNIKVIEICLKPKVLFRCVMLAIELSQYYFLQIFGVGEFLGIFDC